MSEDKLISKVQIPDFGAGLLKAVDRYIENTKLKMRKKMQKKLLKWMKIRKL